MGNTYGGLGRIGKEKRGHFLSWADDFLGTTLALMEGRMGKNGIYVAFLPNFEWWFLVKVDFA